jgi:UDP-perosamine 4-acetyltransferase
MANQLVYLLGGGGHGRVVLDALLSNGVKVAGIVDPGFEVGHKVFDIPVMGGDGWLDGIAPGEAVLANGLGANPTTRIRTEIFTQRKRLGFTFLTLLHPVAILGRDSSLAEGCQIMAGAVIQCCVRIDVNAVINTRASVDHDCHIGAHAFISPGATICGEVRVHDEVFIGASAVLLPGVEIGRGAIVGAGAVVTRSVAEGLVVAGNPAVKIGNNSA